MWRRRLTAAATLDRREPGVGRVHDGLTSGGWAGSGPP